jgi:hypothetical protein
VFASSTDHFLKFDEGADTICDLWFDSRGKLVRASKFWSKEARSGESVFRALYSALRAARDEGIEVKQVVARTTNVTPQHTVEEINFLLGAQRSISLRIAHTVVLVEEDLEVPQQ